MAALPTGSARMRGALAGKLLQGRSGKDHRYADGNQNRRQAKAESQQNDHAEQ